MTAILDYNLSLLRYVAYLHVKLPTNFPIFYYEKLKMLSIYHLRLIFHILLKVFLSCSFA